MGNKAEMILTDVRSPMNQNKQFLLLASIFKWLFSTVALPFRPSDTSDVSNNNRPVPLCRETFLHVQRAKHCHDRRCHEF